MGNRSPPVEAAVDTAVHAAELEKWHLGMHPKHTLGVYRHKQSITREFVFDNTKGSALLFKARAGSLETNYRVHHWSGIPPDCPLCFAPIEDVAHVIRECPVLGPTPDAWSGMSMAELLGLSTMTATPYKDFPHLEDIKARLLRWWILHHKELFLLDQPLPRAACKCFLISSRILR